MLSKLVKGALLTSPIISGGYYTYKMGKWIFEKITSANEPEKENPLSPFPIKQPVVYHFNPVAFVEQMNKSAPCFCNRDLTECEVKELLNKDTFFNSSNCPLPNKEKSLKEFTKQLNATFKNYNIKTCLQRTHFIAQIEAESDHFHTTVEYADGSAYENRLDLGNTNTGDGNKYKGRGLIQITGRANYLKYFDTLKRRLSLLHQK